MHSNVLHASAMEFSLRVCLVLTVKPSNLLFNHWGSLATVIPNVRRGIGFSPLI
jgi:hypothetical protein